MQGEKKKYTRCPVSVCGSMHFLNGAGWEGAGWTKEQVLEKFKGAQFG